MKLGLWVAALILACSCLTIACAHKNDSSGASPNSSFAAEFEGSPEWVRSKRCTDEVIDSPDTHICGVASQPIRSARMIDHSYKQAEAKARAELAKVLGTAVGQLLKNYQAEWAEGLDEEEATAEGKSSEFTKEVTKMKLVGATPSGTWISPLNNQYVVVVMDMERAANALKGMKSLSERQKKVIDAHMEEMNDELGSLPD
jgi:hypothetical protein